MVCRATSPSLVPRRPAHEGSQAGSHLVQHLPHREDIGAVVDLLTRLSKFLPGELAHDRSAMERSFRVNL